MKRMYATRSIATSFSDQTVLSDLKQAFMTAVSIRHHLSSMWRNTEWRQGTPSERIPILRTIANKAYQLNKESAVIEELMDKVRPYRELFTEEHRNWWTDVEQEYQECEWWQGMIHFSLKYTMVYNY